MAGINKVILVGNLGRDPELRFTPGDVAVCSFPLATSETFTDKATGERKTVTEWHHIVLWRKLAEHAERHLHKGSTIYLEGKLRSRNWVDAQGQERHITEVIGDTLQMLDKRSGGPIPPPETNP